MGDFNAFNRMVEDDETDGQNERARQAALDIEDGMKSRYWQHLRGKIAGWLRAEEKHLEILNMRLIRTAEDLEDRNDAVKRIGLLKQFLKINETVRDENLGMVNVRIPSQFVRSHPFVGKPHRTDANGR